MVRQVTYNQQEELNAPQLLGIMFIQIDFDLVLRLTNLGFSVNWDGYEWVGTGDFGDIDPIYEGSTLEARGVTMSLSGIPNDLVASALGEHYQGKKVQIWFGPCDSNGVLIDEPIRVFFGRLDTMNIETGEDSSTISLTAETKVVDWQRPRGGRMNLVDHQARYPGDLGFAYIEELVDKEIRWGME